MKRVGEALQEAREATGLTQFYLAQHLGCTQGFVAQVEAGRRPFPLARYRDLPDAIRGPVIDAALAELQDQADKLEAMR